MITVRAPEKSAAASPPHSAPPAPEPSAANATDGWPDELRDMLIHANEETRDLRVKHEELVERIRELERALEESEAKRAQLAARLKEFRARGAATTAPSRATSKPEEQWLAGVVERTAQTLRSAQKTARGIVNQARSEAAGIEHEAKRDAAERRQRADVEAERILSVAQFDAEGLLEGAQASGKEILAEVHAMRQRAITEFRKRRATLQSEIDDLEVRRLSLLQTYAAMRGPVEDAMRVLESRPSPSAAKPRGRAVLQWLMNADGPGDGENGRERDRR